MPSGDREWSALLASIRGLYGIRRRVDLRRGEGSPIPVTWGIARPVVLLPQESDEWPEDTRRLVLMHELAHIQRLDAGSLLIGRIAAALYWFHPLSWYALHRLRIECEQACDDRVIASGARATSYAHQLLDLARTLRMPRLSVAVAMARMNTLEGRMMAMFDSTRSHEPLGRSSGRWLAACSAILVAGVATFHPGIAPVLAQQASAAKANPKGAGKITGIVFNGADKMPAIGAEVILLDPPPKGQDVYYGKLPLHKVMTDAKGAFTFEGLAPGRYGVWANQEARTSRTEQNRGRNVIVPEDGTSLKPIDLTLSPAPTVTVRITDKATGKPIPGATVSPGWSDFPDDFTADAKGTALVRPLTRQRWMLKAWADGYAKDGRWVNLENGLDAAEAFALEPGGDIEGVIRDPSGKPMPGVGIGASADGSNRQSDYMTTDAQGRYRLRHLPRTAVHITASKDDYGRKEITAEIKGPRQSLDITFEPRPDGGSIVGIVRDHQGKPISGASLRNMGQSSDEVREVKTDANGRFRMDNLYESNGMKDVLVRASGSSPKRVKVEVGTKEKPNEVAIDLEVGHRVRGRVVDEKGRPLKDVRVSFANGNNPFSDGDRTDTDAEGKFSFDALPPDCPFGFSKTGYSEIHRQPLLLDGDGAVEIAMVPAGVIVGQALDAKTGKPIPRMNVQITFSRYQRPGDPSATLRSDLVNPGQTFQSPKGEFKLLNLVAGMPLQVMVSADGYERGVAARVEAAKANEAAIEVFRLEPIDPKSLISYSGVLVDAAGKPVVGANVRLIGSRDRPAGKRADFPFNWAMIRTGQLAQQEAAVRFLESTSDARGHFEFPEVPKDLGVEIAWWGKGIVPGRTDHIERLERKPGEEIEIVTPEGATISGAIDRKTYKEAGRIRINDSEGATDYDDLELKDGQADFELPNLAPGTYTLTLSTKYERTPGGGLTTKGLATKQVKVKNGEKLRLDFKD